MRSPRMTPKLNGGAQKQLPPVPEKPGGLNLGFLTHNRSVSQPDLHSSTDLGSLLTSEGAAWNSDKPGTSLDSRRTESGTKSTPPLGDPPAAMGLGLRGISNKLSFANLRRNASGKSQQKPSVQLPSQPAVPTRLGGEDRQSQAESIEPNSDGLGQDEAPVEPARAEILSPAEQADLELAIVLSLEEKEDSISVAPVLATPPSSYQSPQQYYSPSTNPRDQPWGNSPSSQAYTHMVPTPQHHAYAPSGSYSSPQAPHYNPPNTYPIPRSTNPPYVQPSVPNNYDIWSSPAGAGPTWPQGPVPAVQLHGSSSAEDLRIALERSKREM